MLKLLIFLSLFLTQINLKATDICYPSLFEAQEFTEDYKEKLDFCYEHLVHLEEVLKEERLALMKKANQKKDSYKSYSRTNAGIFVITGLSYMYSIYLDMPGDKSKWIKDPIRLKSFLTKFNISTASFSQFHVIPMIIFAANTGVFAMTAQVVGRKKPSEEVLSELEFICNEAFVTCKKISPSEFLKLEAFIDSSKKKIEDLRKLQATQL